VVASRERELDGREVLDRGLPLRFDRHTQRRYAVRPPPASDKPRARHVQRLTPAMSPFAKAEGGTKPLDDNWPAPFRTRLVSDAGQVLLG
jgi:hypothetical protein